MCFSYDKRYFFYAIADVVHICDIITKAVWFKEFSGSIMALYSYDKGCMSYILGSHDQFLVKVVCEDLC
jgi:hypothetical protein